MKKTLANYKLLNKGIMFPFGMFNGVIVLVSILCIIIALATANIIDGTLSVGLDMAAIIFLAISSASLKPNLKFGMQNGLSRRNFFLSAGLHTLTIGVITGIVITLYELLACLVMDNFTFISFVNVFEMLNILSLDVTTFEYIMNILMYSVGICIWAGALGTLIGVINMRFEKNVKFLIYGLFAMVVIATIILDVFVFNSVIMRQFEKLIIFFTTEFYRIILLALGIHILTYLGSWLLMRKVELK